jgi:galactonate dehydratase
MRIERLRAFLTRDGARPRVVVAIDAQGLTGWGECYSHGPDRALLPLLEHLALQIQGHDATRVEFLVHKLLQQARFPPGALGLAAISAIDHALWELSAKALGVPVFRLLGGTVRDRVQVYGGVYGEAEPERLRDRMEELRARWGLGAFKLHPFPLDPARVPWRLALRAAAGFAERLRLLCPELELAFDAHARLFEPWQAVQLGRVLAPTDPLFLEEPIRPEHVPAWAAVKAQIPCPLATGECLYSRFEFLRLVAAGGCDIVQPDVCAVGGISEMRRIAAIAEAHYVTLAPHNPMGPLATAVNLHFCLSQPHFKILEYRLPGEAPWVADPYLPEDGHLQPRPERPGWGVTIDEAALAREGCVHWERRLPIRPDGSTGYV